MENNKPIQGERTAEEVLNEWLAKSALNVSDFQEYNPIAYQAALNAMYDYASQYKEVSAGVWRKASEKLPSFLKVHGLQYKLDGKKIENGYLSVMPGGENVWYFQLNSTVRIYNLSRIEWLDESSSQPVPAEKDTAYDELYRQYRELQQGYDRLLSEKERQQASPVQAEDWKEKLADWYLSSCLLPIVKLFDYIEANILNKQDCRLKAENDRLRGELTAAINIMQWTLDNIVSTEQIQYNLSRFIKDNKVPNAQGSVATVDESKANAGNQKSLHEKTEELVNFLNKDKKSTTPSGKTENQG